MKTLLPIILAAFCDSVGAAGVNAGFKTKQWKSNPISPSGDLVQAVFSSDRLTLQAVWRNNFTTLAMLEGDQRHHCIFPGNLLQDHQSKVLVTGCDLDDEPLVQIQSPKFGDYLLTIRKDGSIKHVEFDEEEDYEELFFVSDYAPEVAGGHSGRVRRENDYDDDYDYAYSDELVFVADDLADLPDLDDYEVDDIVLPPEVEMQLNLYLDPNFLENFGSKSENKAKQALSQAGLLMQHETLDTKIKLVINTVHNSELHIAFSNASVATKDFNERVPSLLESPFSEEGHPVVHLYLTRTGGRAVKGVALSSSMCNPLTSKQKPLAIVAWTKDAARTSVTIAHELGHLVGMNHDFTVIDQRTKPTCAAYGKGGSILNYGNEPRRTVWSQCSNEDFKTYYSKVLVGPAQQYCLRTTEEANLGCKPDQFRCNNGVCIPASQRCDFLRRDCPSGEDEANCDFPPGVDPFDYF